MIYNSKRNLLSSLKAVNKTKEVCVGEKRDYYDKGSR